MPFFCDLFELTDYNKDSLPPELIPYTQALYFDDSTAEAGAQNYKLLFISPWHGKPGLRQATTDITWTTESGGSVGTALKSAVAKGTEAATIRNNNLVNRTIQLLQDLAPGSSNISEDTKWARREKTLPPWAISAMEFLGLGSEVQGYINRIFNATSHVSQGKAIGDLLDQLKYNKSTQRYVNTTSQLVGGTESKNINTIAIDTSHQGYVKRDATSFKTQVNNIGAAFTSNEEGSILTIDKSIVCKGSNRAAAEACVNELTRILAVVSPFFFYLSPNEKATNGTTEFTALSLTYQVPNNFLVVPTDKAGSKQNSYEVFHYRGELQLRQGYTIYRNLVPAKVIVTASPDMIFLEENPFTESAKTATGAKATNTETPAQPKIGMTKDQTEKAIKFEDRRDKIKAYWQTSQLYKKIKISPNRSGYLFPQWVNVKVLLQTVEPMDGVRASQQLFCYGDSFIKDQ